MTNYRGPWPANHTTLHCKCLTIRSFSMTKWRRTVKSTAFLLVSKVSFMENLSIQFHLQRKIKFLIDFFPMNILLAFTSERYSKCRRSYTIGVFRSRDDPIMAYIKQTSGNYSSLVNSFSNWCIHIYTITLINVCWDRKLKIIKNDKFNQCKLDRNGKLLANRLISVDNRL